MAEQNRDVTILTAVGKVNQKRVDLGTGDKMFFQRYRIQLYSDFLGIGFLALDKSSIDGNVDQTNIPKASE